MLKRVLFGANCYVRGVRYSIGDIAELPSADAKDLIAMRRAELAPEAAPAPKAEAAPAPPAPRPAAPRKPSAPSKEA
jgi:hypothetical protein